MNPQRWLITLVFSLALLAVAGCGPSPVCSDEYIVNKTADTNDGVCDVDDCSLREAVRNANACAGWQTITIPADAYPLTIAGSGEDAAATGDLDITDDVTIVGEGAPSIDGGGLDRVFEVFSPAVVRMETLIVTGGAAQLGAGIRNHSQLTLVGLSIQGNTALVPPEGPGFSSGGGIFNEAGTLILSGTQIFENSADAGGGIHNFATASIEANDLLLGLNTALHGGGMWNNFAAEVVVDGLRVLRNSATGKGAGIYNAGRLEVNLGRFEENVDADQGGGIYNETDGEAFLYDAWFTNNSADLGGGLYNLGLIHLYRSSLTVNTAFGGFGGAIYNGGAGSGVLLRNVTVSGNMADPAAAGGAGLYNAGGEARLEFTTFAHNSPDGILSAGGMVNMRSTILASHALGNCNAVDSAGYNLEDDLSCALIEPTDLSGVDPLLAPLDFNGGLNLNHALDPSSPAVDSGTPDLCTSEDQRAVARPQGVRCDRGAFELESGLIPPTPVVTPTAVPTPTLVPTPTPVGVTATFVMNANCRRGPSTRYFVRTSHRTGVQLPVLGRSGPGFTPWWLVGGDLPCWVSDMTVRVEGPSETVPVVEAPPIPEAPTQLGIPRRMCSTGQGYMVRLEWVDVATSETGYNVYREEVLIATLPANTTTYTDTPPFGGPYTYAVEAFNAYAASSRVEVEDPGCQ